MKTELLDRPIHSALLSHHAHLAVRFDGGVHYTEDYSPFLVLDDLTFSEYSSVPRSEVGYSLVETCKCPAPDGYQASFREITQLVCLKPPSGSASDEIRHLSDNNGRAMLELATLTKPGPFRSRTHQLGRFLGIFHEGELIAMGGERLAFDDMTEISAICTHPDFQGRGLGRKLIQALASRIVSEGRTPFLHSNADNEISLGLYQSLGFQPRLNLWHSMWVPD